MAIKWVRPKGRSVGYIGGVELFTAHYASTSSPDGMWVLATTLPGLSTSALIGKRWPTREDAENAADTVMRGWLEHIGKHFP